MIIIHNSQSCIVKQLENPKKKKKPEKIANSLGLEFLQLTNFIIKKKREILIPKIQRINCKKQNKFPSKQIKICNNKNPK